MHYLALLYGEEDATADPTTEAFAEDLQRYERFEERAKDAIVGGEALEPSDQAIEVRYDTAGAPTVVEGAHAEATEVIGGTYVLEADDLATALDLAARIPAAEDGAVEVRPLHSWFEVARDLAEGERRYLVLLAGPEGPGAEPGTDEWEAGVEAHTRFERDHGEAILGGGALQPSSTGAVVRVRGGEALVTEGAHAEATEIVGGLYLLAADSREALVELGRALPMGPGGLVAMRPIVELDG